MLMLTFLFLVRMISQLEI